MDSLSPDTLLDSLRSDPAALRAFIRNYALLNEQLRAQVLLNEQLRAKADLLLNENTALRLQLHSLTERLRQIESQNLSPAPAAPFRRKRVDAHPRTPRKPGRKPGHPPAWKPIPDHIDEHIVVPLAPCCPHCSTALLGLQPLDQYIEEIIPAKKHVTHLRTHQGYCPRCEQVVASTHPRQVSFAGGAAGTHLGARALAMACHLKHSLGLSFAKTCQALRELGGITITPGGLAHLFQRTANKLNDDYEALRAQLLRSPSVHADETSWYVGKPGPSLWVFCNPRATYYQVVESKTRERFNEVIPPDWPGVLNTDCLSVYDNATPHQQKCYAHHLKAVSRAEEQTGGRKAGSYLDQWRQLLRNAMRKLKSWEQRAPPQRKHEMRILKLAADALLGTVRVDKPEEESVRERIAKQRDHLFVFLEKPGVEPTNNLAERQLRPAVIARKISCGQRSWAGASAWQVLASLAASAKQTGKSFLELVIARSRVSEAQR